MSEEVEKKPTNFLIAFFKKLFKFVVSFGKSDSEKSPVKQVERTYDGSEISKSTAPMKGISTISGLEGNAEVEQQPGTLDSEKSPIPQEELKSILKKSDQPQVRKKHSVNFAEEVEGQTSNKNDGSEISKHTAPIKGISPISGLEGNAELEQHSSDLDNTIFIQGLGSNKDANFNQAFTEVIRDDLIRLEQLHNRDVSVSAPGQLKFNFALDGEIKGDYEATVADSVGKLLQYSKQLDTPLSGSKENIAWCFSNVLNNIKRGVEERLQSDEYHGHTKDDIMQEVIKEIAQEDNRMSLAIKELNNITLLVHPVDNPKDREVYSTMSIAGLNNYSDPILKQAFTQAIRNHLLKTENINDGDISVQQPGELQFHFPLDSISRHSIQESIADYESRLVSYIDQLEKPLSGSKEEIELRLSSALQQINEVEKLKRPDNKKFWEKDEEILKAAIKEVAGQENKRVSKEGEASNTAPFQDKVLSERESLDRESNPALLR